MPPASKSKSNLNGRTKRSLASSTLSELSQNVDSAEIIKRTSLLVSIDSNNPLRITRELLDSLKQEKKCPEEFINQNLEASEYNLEVFGWSKGRYISSSFYDDLISSSQKIKRLALRGRGIWNTCKCPSKKSNGTQQIDVINPENTTTIEGLYIMRPFQIKACTLLDLIARSPRLKVLRFYGVLLDDEHHRPFETVRFLSELDRLYWPWCNRKLHLPTLKTLAKRNDSITTFYSNGDTTCDILGSDLLPNLKHLSLILNENWASEDGSTKKPSRYLRKIPNLSLAKKLEALEIRTFKLELDDFEEEVEATIRRLYENYQLSFWENIAKLPNLKFLSIYGAWELDSVARELARHGLQIEHLKTNLVPSSMMPSIDAGEDLLELEMGESIKELRKLTKLRSLHFACHENLANIDPRTVSSLKELVDLIWVFDLRIACSAQVEELIANIIRRGNQQGKVFNVKLHIESSKNELANTFVEAVVKFSANLPIGKQLQSIVEQEAKEKFGRVSIKKKHLWGLEQVGHRERAVYDKLKAAWDYYNEIFQPLDMYA